MSQQLKKSKKNKKLQEQKLEFHTNELFLTNVAKSSISSTTASMYLDEMFLREQQHESRYPVSFYCSWLVLNLAVMSMTSLIQTCGKV